MDKLLLSREAAEMVSVDSTVKLADWGWKGWKLATATDWWHSWRNRKALKTLLPLHLGFVHSARKLANQMQNWDKEHTVASHLAVEVCTKCRESMGQVLRLRENHLHCCLKMMAKADETGERVGTWARSQPLDARPTEMGDEKSHHVGSNSVWCALMGLSDGSTLWLPGFTCFSCNDLPALGSKFKCDRENWSNYYKSALVFPMRYAKTSDGSELANIGFLAFDSPQRGSFRGLPNIYDYTDKSAEYLDQLHKSPAFHLGAIFADALGTFLGAAYEAALKEAALKEAALKEAALNARKG